MKGFLGTYGNFAADLNLLLQIAMGVALLAGSWLARAKRYRAHGACQSAVLILNLFLIALVMWPAFRQQVLPRIPARLNRAHFAIATAHGALGAVAEIFGLYIVLAAGTNVLPQSWRFRRWKLWMRAELVLWWIVLVTGVATYFIWYVPMFRP
jgi:uncharacterized membrane protein YozB (DUF420 family)